ncbi:SH3-like domain-containing protein [Phenylobacterium sp.]|jgi:nitrile hydratase subunit beta|uniref:SH3-like domain-containing protein n=1 Tax=Phenylobacterium sp. TaxID=1871053 RepID=UPI001207BF5E|nr:SH3-like domain-containing protein [Phenylobacterium sp.]THD56337.1 MAG: nitrile hydratase subunit beta [Phenylobacterium sp.]
MTGQVLAPLDLRGDVVLATGEAPGFEPGDTVRVMTRSPIGHYRVPRYLRGKTGDVVAVIRPMAVDNEEEGYGRNAGSKGHYYRVAFPMAEVWPGYVGGATDQLLIEVFQTWLERA